jgi:phosphodiesterase/alkaline phosphatase D-like protein
MTKSPRWTIALLLSAGLALIAPNCPNNPLFFEQGVASGDATDTSAVLWTRANHSAVLRLEVSSNPSFMLPHAFAETAFALPDGDLTVKVTATGLDPDTPYFYRWRFGNTVSVTGEFRTAPTATTAASARFAFSGDSDGTLLGGVPFFNDFEALDAVRAEGLDFFVYLGDQIYSDSFVRGLAGMGPAVTLDEYRDTWKVNREVAALRDLLKATSIFTIWDDHEVFNDYDGQTVDPVRYATGRQAYFEYMPNTQTGFPSDPVCAGDPLFQVFHWGSEIDLITIDERSCRSADVEAACLGDLAPTLPAPLRVLAGLPAAPPPGCLTAIFDPARTFLGPVQKQLFKDALLASTAKFKFVINELPIQQFYALPYDRWEGYGAERNEILNFIRDNAIEDVIFLATDIHANLVNDVFIDAFTDPQSIANEFVTGPIARSTFGENVAAVVGPAGLAQLQLIFSAVLGVECQALDAFSYAVVDVDANAGTATITHKDDSGNVLVDDLTAMPCTQTIGP